MFGASARYANGSMVSPVRAAAELRGSAFYLVLSRRTEIVSEASKWTGTESLSCLVEISPAGEKVSSSTDRKRAGDEKVICFFATSRFALLSGSNDGSSTQKNNR